MKRIKIVIIYTSKNRPTNITLLSKGIKIKEKPDGPPDFVLMEMVHQPSKIPPGRQGKAQDQYGFKGKPE